MKRKTLHLLLVASMIAAMLAGCATPTPAPVATTAAPVATTTAAPTEAAATEQANAQPATIYMFISQPEYSDAINKLIAQYKTVKPNVTINYETTQSDYPTLLKTKINAGEIPDIFSSTSGKEIATYLDYTYNFAGTPAAGAMADSVKSVMSSGDGVYGFALKGNYFGIVYNKAIFEKVGVDFPKTYSALEAACEKIKAAGYQPFTTGFAEWWVYKHVWQHFFSAASDNAGDLAKKFQAGQAKIKDYPMIYDNYFNFLNLAVKYGDAKPLETNLSAEEAAMAAGNTAMMLGQGAWVESDIMKINPDFQLGFAGYPVSDDPKQCLIIGGSDQALRINKDSKVLNDVMDFVNWWYTSDYGKAWFSDVAGVIPPIKNAKIPNLQIPILGSKLESTEGSASLAVVYYTDASHQAMGETLQSYLAGTITKDQACSQIEAKWVELEK